MTAPLSPRGSRGAETEIVEKVARLLPGPPEQAEADARTVLAALSIPDLAQLLLEALGEDDGWLPEPAVILGVKRAFDRHITNPNSIQRENVIGTFRAVLEGLAAYNELAAGLVAEEGERDGS